MHQAGSNLDLFQSSQATVLELWASPDLQGPPGTQLHTFWNHLETTQKHRKRADLTDKCLKQKVIPELFQSSQATVLDLWPSLDLQGPPGTQLHTFWNQLETTQPQKTNKLDRKMPQAESRPRPLPELSGPRSEALDFP